MSYTRPAIFRSDGRRDGIEEAEATLRSARKGLKEAKMRRIKAEGRDPTVSSLARRLSESRQENNYAERMRLAFEMTRKDAND